MFQSSLSQVTEKREYKCLVANDDPLCLAILEAIFDKLDFRVVCASNG